MPAPKNLFLQSKDKCRLHLALVKSDAFDEACVYAMADYAADTPTDEQMRGAQRFLDRFIHLAEPEEERPNPFASPRLTPPEQL
jgi:hypothetical protein